MSLSQLKPRGEINPASERKAFTSGARKESSQASVDVSGLRKALDEALKSPEPRNEDSASVETTADKQELRDGGNQKKKIEPGETVRF